MKKSYILMLVAMLCMFATGCKKDELKTIGRFVVSEQGFADPDSKMHLTWLNGATSHLSYDNTDVVLINGYHFTLHKSGTQWYAEEQNHDDVTASHFYCIYSTPNMGITCVDDNAYEYGTSFTEGTPAVATHHGILLAGSTEDSLLTLKPACAIIRFPAEGAQMDYVRVGFSNATIPSGGRITISDAGDAAISPFGYLGGVTADNNGQFLEMITDPNNGYMTYYVAVPIASTSVNTQLFLTWKYSGDATVYKYKTSSAVTLQRGKVYTIGKTRTSPFNEDGSTKKMFDVGGGTMVYFSCGNLQFQYKDATVKWRFAEHQYDKIGIANINVSPAYEGWIDLFGWGTSGWASGANARTPYATSTTNSDYWPGGSSSNDLTGSHANADWGVRNSDGVRHILYGNTNSSASWRTLTAAEWYYLVNRVGKCGYATIAGTYKGVVLLPESWTLPDGLSFTPGITGSANQYNNNTYSLDEWGQMEYAGAVFLPATGYRDGAGTGSVYSPDTEGNYWSTTHYNNNNALELKFTEEGVDMDLGEHRIAFGQRHKGFAVRLVKEFEDPFGK